MNLLNCKPVENEMFHFEDIDFQFVIKLINYNSNYSVEIYGTNLMGTHLLVDKIANIISGIIFILFLIL